MAVALEHGCRYHIINAKGGRALDLGWESDPTTISGRGYNGGPNQTWEASEESGFWHFKNVEFGKYLAVGLYSTPANGVDITASYTRFNWTIESGQGDPSLLRICLPGTAYIVDLCDHNSKASTGGIRIQLYVPFQGNKNQWWKFKKINNSVTRGRFYHETVVLEVEGAIYRVAVHEFEKWSRSAFRDTFAPHQGGPHRKGETDDNPIRLDGCTRAEFESLIEVMYPPGLTVGPRPALSKDDWANVLKMSRLLDMPDIASLAIRKLTDCRLTPMEMTMLGKAHGVPAWLNEGYIALTNDLSQASFEDISKLGWETAARLLWTREEISRFHEPAHSNRPGQIDGSASSAKSSWLDSTKNMSDDEKSKIVAEKVSQTFGEELKEAEERNAVTTDLCTLHRFLGEF